MISTDVLIVGAGPTGLALACQLARYGVDLQLIDKKETTNPESRAIGVQARTLEIYEQIGLADDLIALGNPAGKVRLLEGGKIRGEVELENIGTDMSPYPFLLIVEQGTHEELLYRHIRAAGHDVRWQTEMTSLEQSGESVSVNVASPAGDETIVAKYVVGCDGARSAVRHALGLTFEGDTVERLFYVADVIIDWAFDHDALHANLGESTLTAFFPLPGDRRWRIVGTFPEGHDKDEGEILYEEIERQIEDDTELEFDITQVNWFSVYKVHSRAVNKFSDGRCFVAGDAAHIHSPAGAQGMNTGIQDGYNLAWKLALACSGDAGASLLDTYNEERLPNARRLLRTTDRFFEFGASDEWFTSFVRTRIFPYVAGFAFSLDIVKRAIFPLVSQIGINYRDSSLSRSQGHFSIHAGERMPWFEIDGESIYDRLHEPKFHLIVFDDGEAELPELDELQNGQFNGLVDVHVVPLYPKITEIFGTRRTFVVLLRPDNYIGLISDDVSTVIVTDYIETATK